MSELVDVLCSTAVLRHLHRSRARAARPDPQPPDPEPAGARLRRPEPIGQALVRRGLLTQDQLDRALAAQRRSGERLGRVLLTAGYVHRRDLQEVLAECWDCRFVDLVEEPPDEALVRTCSDERMVREGWVPVARDGSVVRVATCERPTPERREAVEEALGAPVLFEVTTDWDIQYAIQTVFAASLAHRAAYGLSERDPEQSARAGFTRWQKVAALGALCATAAAAAFDWRLTLIAVCALANLWFLLAVGFKVVTVFAAGGGRCAARGASRRSIPDDELPIYTVLVPGVPARPTSSAAWCGHLARLDYPPEKLEILLLMEEEDTETIDAARAAQPAGHGHVRDRPARASRRPSRGPATWASSSPTASSW